MTEDHQIPILDSVAAPSDLGEMRVKDLRQLAIEIQKDTIRNVSFIWEDLGASLRVIKLTVAIH